MFKFIAGIILLSNVVATTSLDFTTVVGIVLLAFGADELIFKK